MTKEEFRSINKAGFEHYHVSNMGRIRNSNTGNILKATKTVGANNKITYTFNAKSSDGRMTRLSIGREVARAFIKDFSENLRVDHLDGDISNNMLDNIVLVSKTKGLMDFKAKQSSMNSKNTYTATIVADNTINALQNLHKLITDIESCKENIIAYDKFSQDILHDIEMHDMDDEQLLTKAKMIKDVRNKRRYNKNVEIISEFISKQLSSAGLSASKIEIMISKLNNAKAKLEATENGKSYNRRFNELSDNQKQTIEQEVLSEYGQCIF